MPQIWFLRVILAGQLLGFFDLCPPKRVTGTNMVKSLDSWLHAVAVLLCAETADNWRLS